MASAGAPGATASGRPDPASFRDYDNRVFTDSGRIFRALTEEALDEFRALAATELFRSSQESGCLVGTREAEGIEPPAGAELAAGTAAVLEHDRIPFVSWPYEWPFSMLRDAALSQLDLLDDALSEGFVLKDGTPYNTQWVGTRPVFIDIGSIERWREGEPWFGYRQFCMQFLYPLMLQSVRGVPFQPFLRGRIEGITPEEAARMLRGRDRLRRGVLTHVVLHARLERKHAQRTATDARAELKRAGFRKELIQANARQLRRLVQRLDWAPASSAWSGYRAENTYSADAATEKTEFVREAAARRRPRLTWDLGCNDGHFSRVVAETGSYVLAIDADQLSVDRLYRELRRQQDERILPLTFDLVDAPPSQGWRGAERGDLLSRGRPDLVLALALVHHMTIGAGVPVEGFVDWLASLGGDVVVEFPDRDDPMVARLLGRKRDGAHPDYGRKQFEAALGARFEIHRRQELGTRTLYEATPR